MFGSSPTTDRRAFLAAAPALALLTAGPAATLIRTAVPSRMAWNAAMDRYTTAKAEMEHYESTAYMPAYHRMQAFMQTHGAQWPSDPQLAGLGTDWQIPGAIEDRYEALVTAFCAAEDELMETAAPDRPALAWKLDKILEPHVEGGSTPSWSREYVDQTVADYRRLLAEG